MSRCSIWTSRPMWHKCHIWHGRHRWHVHFCVGLVIREMFEAHGLDEKPSSHCVRKCRNVREKLRQKLRQKLGEKIYKGKSIMKKTRTISGAFSGACYRDILWHIFWSILWHNFWRIFWHNFWRIFWSMLSGAFSPSVLLLRVG